MRYLDFKDNQLHGTGWHLWFGHCFATFQTWATGKDCGDGYCRREEYIQTMTSFWLLLLMGRVILWTLLGSSFINPSLPPLALTMNSTRLRHVRCTWSCKFVNGNSLRDSQLVRRPKLFNVFQVGSADGPQELDLRWIQLYQSNPIQSNPIQSK